MGCEKKSDGTFCTQNFEDWPGKNGAVKTNIGIPAQFFLSDDMSFRESSTTTFVRFKIALDENDLAKGGYIQTQIYSSVLEAQLALNEYLETITNPNGLPCLTGENFTTGDVAFGRESDKLMRICFVKNNVFTIVYAPTVRALSISSEIESEIIGAAEWKDGMPDPSFVLPE